MAHSGLAQEEQDSTLHEMERHRGEERVDGMMDGDTSTSSDLDDSDFAGIFPDQDGESLDINPRRNPLLWVQSQIARCVDPKIIIRQLVPGIMIPDNVPEMSVWRLIFEIITEPTPRQPLSHVCSIESVVKLIRDCKNIIVLTGAGVSVSCGIPDFRSRDGIYARLSKDFPDLPDPQSMFDINFFHSNPYPFFRFAKEIYPGSFKPSLSHRFIQQLEASGRLLRNYTQNIDTLEQVAGIKNVVTCHGSFATASCMNCKIKVDADEIKGEVFAQRIPYCKVCTPTEGAMNILKPDIVFFGEGLPEEFHTQIKEDKERADLLIVIGSSLKVRPVALIPSFLKPNVPQILINREQLPHMQFDVELYGNCDDVICELCSQLGSPWEKVVDSFVPTPVDYQKYKYLFETSTTDLDTSTSENEGNPVEKVECTCSAQTLGNSETVTCNCMSLPNEHLSHDHSENLKRKCDEKEDENVRKSLKLDCEEKTDNATTMEVNYLFYPPNGYIFHGAEMDCGNESEDDDLAGAETERNVSDEEGVLPSLEPFSESLAGASGLGQTSADNTSQEKMQQNNYEEILSGDSGSVHSSEQLSQEPMLPNGLSSLESQ